MTEENDTQQLLSRIDQFNQALCDGDKDQYGDVFVDDFVFTWSDNGATFSKTDILPNVTATPDYSPIVDEQLTRIYGDAAVVNFRLRREETDSGTRVTFSFARIGEGWKAIAVHSTKIAST